MTCYAVGQLTSVEMGPEIEEYLQGIDSTLAPYDGRFLVHGGAPEILEGDWTGDLIVIAFPDRAAALAWYRSEAYRAILPLRLEKSDGNVFLIDGVSAGHKATDILAA